MDKQKSLSYLSDKLAYVRTKKSDPDARSVKKDNTWHFGYKAYVGTDKDTGFIMWK